MTVKSNYKSEKITKEEIKKSTDFPYNETIILQILPENEWGYVQIKGKKAPKTFASVFIPKSEKGYYNCPLNYFQNSVSLTEKWIINDNTQKKIVLNNINNLKRVIITIKTNDKEKKVKIPMSISERLLDYFKLGVNLNPEKFKGFDCYAFVSFLANVRYNPKCPDFEYYEKSPRKGDIVGLANNHNLPDSIQHWALYLGNNQYISKFGKTGEGAECLVHILTLEGMNTLYDCEFLYVATPKEDAEPFGNYWKSNLSSGFLKK